MGMALRPGTHAQRRCHELYVFVGCLQRESPAGHPKQGEADRIGDAMGQDHVKANPLATMGGAATVRVAAVAAVRLCGHQRQAEPARTRDANTA